MLNYSFQGNIEMTVEVDHLQCPHVAPLVAKLRVSIVRKAILGKAKFSFSKQAS